MATKFLDASGLKYVINKIKVLLSTKQDKLTFDTTPTANSDNPVTSDGIKKAIDAKDSVTTATKATQDGNGNVISDTYQEKGNYISYTNATPSVAGTTKTVSSILPNSIYVGNGIIMGGTAQQAGLVTRGVCGVSTPSANGACNKENLYVNYDGNNDYNPNGRGLILNAINAGNSLGNGMYEYAVPRGDTVKAWVEAKKYAPLASPILTGTPTAPTATAGTNTTQIATTAFVTNAIPTNVSSFTNDAGYLTTHQDLSGYETKAEVSAIMAGCTEDAITALWSDT